MSYWVSLWIETGDDASTEVWDRNITSNLARMWCEAGVPLHKWDNKPASEASQPLIAAVKKMQDEREKFEAMNPENGWGNYEGCLDFLESLQLACSTHHKCTLRVSH